MARCNQCRYQFAVPEGEEGEHDCPRCGWDGGRAEAELKAVWDARCDMDNDNQEEQ